MFDVNNIVNSLDTDSPSSLLDNDKMSLPNSSHGINVCGCAATARCKAVEEVKEEPSITSPLHRTWAFQLRVIRAKSFFPEPESPEMIVNRLDKEPSNLKLREQTTAPNINAQTNAEIG